MPDTPREQALAAFQAQLGFALGGDFLDPITGKLPRNQPQPADLASGGQVVIQVDGPEHAPTVDPMTGFILRRATVHVEGYVRVNVNEDPGPAANALRGKILLGVLSDRTLGGVLYGKLTSGIVRHGQESYYAVDRPHLDSLEEGPLDIEVMRQPGTPGMGFAQEFVLQYATTPDDPETLVTMTEGDA